MKKDNQSVFKFDRKLLLKVSGEYARQREEAGVPFEKYPFFLDEEGIARLPEDVKEKAQKWLVNNKR